MSSARNRLIYAAVLTIALISPASAEASLGAYAGAGIPFTGQVGLTYGLGDSFVIEASYNRGQSLTSCRQFDLVMPQLNLNYYPFGQALFVGLGVGRTSLTAGNLDPATNNPFTIEAQATLAFAKLGWTWGMKTSGFWFGVDVSGYQSLEHTKKINAAGVDRLSKEYRVVADAVEIFAETTHMNITLARLGWTF